MTKVIPLMYDNYKIYVTIIIVNNILKTHINPFKTLYNIKSDGVYCISSVQRGSVKTSQDIDTIYNNTSAYTNI